jgi:hypothetical protein
MFWFGAIVSLCYVPGFTGALIATQWPVLSILLPLALWRSGPVTVLHWAGLLFVVYATVHLWFTPIVTDGVAGLWFVYIMALSFWLGSTLDDLRGLYAGLAVGASVSSAIAVFQYFGISVVPYVSLNPAGLYVNSVVQGTVLALIVVALVSERMWLWVPLLLPGIVLSGSRGAWVVLAIGLAAVPWIFGSALAVLGAFFTWHPVHAVGAETKLLGASDTMRLFIWDAAAHNLTWFGWGPGSFFSWLLWYDGNSLYPEYAHNDALQLIFEYGVFAALPIGIFVFAVTRTKEREWPVVVAFAAAGLYSMPLWMPVASFLGLAVTGRVVRGWAVARRELRSRRFDFVPREHCYATHSGSGAVPVVASYQTESASIW